jgi:methyl-accepting chemotaxis protein
LNEKINSLNVFNYRNLPLIVFVILTFGGCCFIAVSKVSGMNPVFSMFVPILLMFGYLVLAWSFSAIRLHDEQTGDNLYYMGFLFTLASLGASLYLFTGDSSTDDVVRNFGIAISSTITGIALRIFYNQTRRDVLDIERATRHDLAAAARRVRTELETSSRDFASLRRANNQLINEGFEGVVAQVEKTGKKLEKSLLSMSDLTLKPLEDVSVKFNKAIDDSLKSVTEKLNEAAKKIEDSSNIVTKANQSVLAVSEELTDRVSDISKKLEAVTIPDSVLKNEMEPLLQQLASFIKDQAIRADAMANEQSGRIDKLLGSVTTISELVANNASQSEKLIQTNMDLAEQVKSQHELMNRIFRERQFEGAEPDPIVVGDKNPLSEQTLPTPEVIADAETADTSPTNETKGWWPFK